MATQIPGEPAEGTAYNDSLRTYSDVGGSVFVPLGALGGQPDIVLPEHRPVEAGMTCRYRDSGAIWHTVTVSSYDQATLTITMTENLPAIMPGNSSLFILTGRTNNFTSGTLVNDQTVGHPEQLLICDRTGFKIPVSEGLVEEWNGRKVRKKSFERRHPQDFLRSRSDDELAGSDRPEQDDQFIADLHPSGVQASDL